MTGSEVHDDAEKHRGRDTVKNPKANGDKSSTRDPMTSLERRVSRVEVKLAEDITAIEDLGANFAQVESDCQGMNARLSSLEIGHDGIREELVALINNTINTSLNNAIEVVKEHVQAELVDVKEEIADLKSEVTLVKRAMANGPAIAQPTSTMEVPRPKSFQGSRNARELENFLWSLEQYFEALGIRDENTKVKTAPLYLSDVAMLWWRRTQGDINKGACVMESWDDFKREIKRQFYPENVEFEARSRLRRLAHEGEIRGYVKEFSELLLEIPDYTDKEAMFTFLDGLQPWAKLELQRRGVQSLAEAMAIAESLVEYHEPEERAEFGGNGGGRDYDRDTRRRGRPDQGGSHKVEKPLTCFLCDGPHRVRDCPRKHKLSAMKAVLAECSSSEEEAEEAPRVEPHVAKIGCMKRLSAIKRAEEPLQPEQHGQCFVEAKLNQRKTKALVDTGASCNLLDVGEAQRLGITYEKKKRGWMKATNSRATRTHGVARQVPLKLGGWTGVADFEVVSLDDYQVIIGMEFMVREKAFPIPYANRFCIKGGARSVPMTREQLESNKRCLARQEQREVATMVEAETHLKTRWRRTRRRSAQHRGAMRDEDVSSSTCQEKQGKATMIEKAGHSKTRRRRPRRSEQHHGSTRLESEPRPSLVWRKVQRDLASNEAKAREASAKEPRRGRRGLSGGECHQRGSRVERGCSRSKEAFCSKDATRASRA
ncbi:unnamed protein product [Linum trigynum]|uniref:Retrotransposon gag domain-containing protein n=1 Tax=Linum trigynum TaxID=586398 RepID=A0AAV2DHR0_9ROSI